MGGPVRTKRVTHLLDDQAKARLVGADHRTVLSYGSSGSEHDGEDGGNSPCLSELVHDFLEVERDDDDDGFLAAGEGSPPRCDSGSERADSIADCTDAVERVLEEALASNDPYRSLLSRHVSEAMKAFSCLLSSTNKPALRRKVMSRLRDIGHNAAVCKTKWDASGGLTAGNYEFIDVVVVGRPGSSSPDYQERYIVDLDFAGEFEIARPAPEYARLLQRVPRVFVGRAEELKKIVRAMCDAARRSLKSRGLSLPPWRKNRYMQNKWLAPYRRTVSPSPGNPFATPAMSASAAAVVKCRWVGFDESRNGPLFVRTR